MPYMDIQTYRYMRVVSRHIYIYIDRYQVVEMHIDIYIQYAHIDM